VHILHSIYLTEQSLGYFFLIFFHIEVGRDELRIGSVTRIQFLFYTVMLLELMFVR